MSQESSFFCQQLPFPKEAIFASLPSAQFEFLLLETGYPDRGSGMYWDGYEHC